jgi:hypothetical protein
MKDVVTSIESLITRGYASIFIFFPASTITLLLIHFFSGQCLLSVELLDILVNNLNTIRGCCHFT